MSVEEMFDRVAARLVEEDRGVDQGRILHSVGVKAAGKFFAFVARGELVVKLPAGRVDELVGGGAGRPFDAGKGRPMREWVRLQPGDEDACAGYMEEARDFVAARS